ncbi:MAG: helix-turn-helix transcriptional regulator [Candidatus Omnitrophica bacterium]|nr:helix-turn-helix transcriptional regulator [Candidatus Omnitrophota bacterium]
MKNLGKEIRASRQISKLTAKDLANKIGVDPTYITYIEKHGKIPSPAVMKKIEDVLDDPMLGSIYLETKYPEVCKEFEEGQKNIADEFLRSIKNALKNHKTSEEKKEIKRRLEEYKAKLGEIVRRFSNTIVKLEDMEKSIDLKNTPEQKDKSKD